MKVSFAAARRINLAIRVVAAIIAAIPVPFVLVVLLILGFWWGVDFTVFGVFEAFYRFFVRLFSGHTLRPITLYATSAPTPKAHRAATRHV
jgi:fatty acid desaturase